MEQGQPTVPATSHVLKSTNRALGLLVAPLPLSKKSPNLNGRCERFILTIKQELLSKFLVFGKRHLDYLLVEFVDYYNRTRSHSALDSLPPIRVEQDEVEAVSIRSRSRSM